MDRSDFDFVDSQTEDFGRKAKSRSSENFICELSTGSMLLVSIPVWGED